MRVSKNHPREASLTYAERSGEVHVSLNAMPGASAPLRREAIAAVTERWGSWKRSPERDARELAEIGHDLGRVLLPHAFQRRLQSEIGSAREREAPFHLYVEGEGGFLANIPWEALRLSPVSPVDPVAGIIALEPDVSLMRRLHSVGHGVLDDRSGTRILVASANPSSWLYPRLAWLSTEVQAIESACGRALAFQVDVRTLLDASPEELRRAVREFRPHIFHFSGHAEAETCRTRLVLHDDRSDAARLADVGAVGEWLADGGCRLAVLSACKTDGGPGSAALTLRQAGLPAVIAMQDEVRDASQPTFSRALYGALLDGVAIDRAVAEARLAIASPAASEILPTLWCDVPFTLVGRHAPAPSTPIPNNLPAPEPDEVTVGRARELAQIVQDLGSSRAACLVGAGGIGKSHLARAVARKLLTTHSDGVWFVECEAMETEEDVWLALASLVATDCRELSAATTVAALRSGRTLVVLDCFERLAARNAIGVVERLLKETGAALLITSRTMVDVQDVRCVEVGPLEFGRIEEAAESLVLQLAGLDRRRLDMREAAALSEICATLDGVPLALAVAAGRARLVGVSPLRELLAQSPIRALGGAGSPIVVAVERSLSLLPVDDGRLLDRLSVFSGGFSWASATEVYPDDRFAMLDGIERLVACALLRRLGEGADARFGISDPVRDYLAMAMRSDAKSHDREIARLRHASHCSALAREVAGAFKEGRWVEGTRLIRLEIANFRAALSFAASHALYEVVTPLARCLCRPLLESGMWSDFVRFSTEGYRAAEFSGDSRLRAELLGLEGALAGRRGDDELCERAWTQRATLCRERGDAEGFVDATLDLSGEARSAGDFERALALVADAERSLLGLARLDLEATAAVTRAVLELDLGRPDRAREAALDAEAVAFGIEEKDAMLYVKTQLGHLWRRLGDMPLAERAYLGAADDAMDGDRRSQAAIAAIGLSFVFERRRKIEAALMCAVAAETILYRLGSRRLSEAKRHRARLCDDHRGHPALSRLSHIVATDPFRLLAETLGRARASGGPEQGSGSEPGHQSARR